MKIIKFVVFLILGVSLALFFLSSKTTGQATNSAARDTPAVSTSSAVVDTADSNTDSSSDTSSSGISSSSGLVHYTLDDFKLK